MYTPRIKKPRLNYLFLAAIILVILIALFRDAVVSLTRAPFFVLSDFAKDVKGIYTYKFILNENIKLRSQADELKKEVVQFDELRLENQRLKDILSLRESSPFVSIAANIIGCGPNNWSSGVIIDKGKAQGIKVGNAVITGLGLAGRVTDITDSSSKVMLLDDPDSCFSCIIQRTREEGLVCGTLLGKLILRYLDKNSGVKEGDCLLTGGAGSSPAGLIIGPVDAVKKDRFGFVLWCSVKPAVNLRRVEEVLVIKEH